MNRSARDSGAPHYWRDEVTIAAVLALLAAALALGGWAWRLDRLVYDLGLSLWSRPAPADIVIVAIDDASVEQIGRWPWRRAVHASMLEILARARPRAVALDLVLSEPDPDPQQDVLLAAALTHAAPVVLPVAWRAAAVEALAPMEPAPPLRAVTTLGAAESAVDADGVLRHAFLRAGPPGALYPHLALALLQAGGEGVHPAVRAEPGQGGAPGSGWQREGRFLIRFAGAPGTVERVSYADVLRAGVAAERLAGRYVLVGMTAQGLGDTLATPVNGRHHAMPGIEVLANTLQTLRSGDAIHAVGDAQVAALSACLLVALVLSFGIFGPRTALPAALATVPLAVIASLVALRAGWWFSPVPYALPALLAYPLSSWRRLERAVAGLDQEIARHDADPLASGAQTSIAPPGDDIESRLQTLRRAGTLLREARRFLADALAAMPTAMLVADENARVVLANPKAAALFEAGSVVEMQGLDLVRLLAEFSTAEVFDWSAAIAALNPAGVGIAVEGRVAAGHDFVVHVAAVDLQGLRRLIVSIADIEPVKQAQREREEVLAFVSHDLRSPASSIVVLADLDLQGLVQTPHAELLREVRRLAARTLEMSEDFVRAAQVQTQALVRAPVGLQALVHEALADLRAQAMAAGVSLQTRQAWADTGAEVSVDRRLVARAIANLVSNAIKHSPRGAAVEIETGVHDALLQVRVRDHGPGLSAQQLVQLARGDEGAVVQEMRGVGLGLLFVQRVARRHGGRLRVGVPADGRGALFELDVPVSGNP